MTYYKSETLSEAGNTKTIVNIPAWAQALHEGSEGQKDTINNAAAAYAFVPLVYRAVRLRADALARVPLYFTKLDGETEVVPPFEGVDWKDLLWKSEAALCLQGWNFIEKIPRVRSKKVGALQWINPVTMTTRYTVNEDKTLRYTFQQGNSGSTWTLDEMIYMREFSLSSGFLPNDFVRPGDSAANVALNDAALIRYMSRFAARFFETGAMPITVLSIDGILDKDEATRIENFFRRAASGIKNAFRVIGLSRAIEPKVISQPVKDLVIPELNSQARHAVSLAFGIPQTMLEDAANFATSQEHRLSFWQDTVMPRGEWIAEQFNKQLLAEFKIKMSFAFEEMDVFQEDENARAQSLGQIVTAINTNPAIAKWTMGVLGYDLTEEQEAELEAIANKPEPEPQPTTTTPPSTETVTETPPAKAAWMDDIGRWERKALRVFKENGSAVCEYVSDLLPSEIRVKITAGLQTCKTAEDIKALFDVQPVTQTKAAEYKSNPDALALAESINKLAEVYLKSLQVTPAPVAQPNINVTLPPITMTAQLPASEPVINFTPTIEAKAADQPAPQVTFAPVIQPSEVAIQNKLEQQINVQPAENVNEITVQPAEVKMPKPKREKQTVRRNKQTGLIESTDTKIEYEE